ncbi:MAG: hypothetical protein HY606_15205 [Planctomycetes bacterium]|nr:hypothetical protein [Planctomycetota bacterium]
MGKILDLLRGNWIIGLFLVALGTLPFSTKYLPTDENIYKLYKEKINKGAFFYDKERYNEALKIFEGLTKTGFKDIDGEALLFKARTLIHLVHKGEFPVSYIEIDIPNILNEYATKYKVDEHSTKLYVELLQILINKSSPERSIQLIKDGMSLGLIKTENLNQLLPNLLLNLELFDSETTKKIFRDLSDILDSALKTVPETQKTNLLLAQILLDYKMRIYKDVIDLVKNNIARLKDDPEFKLLLPIILEANNRLHGTYNTGIALDQKLVDEITTLLDAKKDQNTGSLAAITISDNLNQFVKQILTDVYNGNFTEIHRHLKDERLLKLIMYSYILELSDIINIINFTLRKLDSDGALKELLDSLNAFIEKVKFHPQLLQIKAELLNALGKNNKEYLLQSAELYIEMSLMPYLKRDIRKKWFDLGIKVLQEGELFIKADQLYGNLSYLFSTPLSERRWNHAKLMILEGVYKSTLTAIDEYVRGQLATDPLVPELILEASKINLVLGNLDDADKLVNSIDLLKYKISPIQRAIMDKKKILYSDALLQRALIDIEKIIVSPDANNKFRALIRIRSNLDEYIERYKDYYNDENIDLYMATAYKLLIHASIEQNDSLSAVKYMQDAETLNINKNNIEQNSFIDILLSKSYMLYLNRDYNNSAIAASKAENLSKDPRRKLFAKILNAKSKIRLNSYTQESIDSLIKEIDLLLAKDDVIREVKDFLKSEKDVILVLYGQR